MIPNKIFAGPELAPAEPISFDPAACVGCNRCVEVCQVDVLVPNETAGAPPVPLFPGECWYCGCCVMECPTKAIRLRHPLMNQAQFRLKSSLLDPVSRPR